MVGNDLEDLSIFEVFVLADASSGTFVFVLGYFVAVTSSAVSDGLTEYFSPSVRSA